MRKREDEVDRGEGMDIFYAEEIEGAARPEQGCEHVADVSSMRHDFLGRNVRELSHLWDNES